MAEQNDDAAIETQPPETDDQGFELAGDWPLNHRLRAEAMARAGVAEDPDGHISPELIAETGERLKSEDEAADEAARADPPLDRMTKAQLEKTAATEGVDLSSASNNPDRVSLIQAARDAKTGA
jgi:hypothetical protein